MEKQSLLYGLAVIGVLLVIGLLYLQFGVDNRILIDQKYVVGKKDCDTKFCITPLFISSDRHTGSLLVYDLNANKSCVQDINNGVLVPLHIYDCREGMWNGEKGPSTGVGIAIEPGFSS